MSCSQMEREGDVGENEEVVKEQGSQSKVQVEQQEQDLQETGIPPTKPVCSKSEGGVDREEDGDVFKDAMSSMQDVEAVPADVNNEKGAEAGPTEKVAEDEDLKQKPEGRDEVPEEESPLMSKEEGGSDEKEEIKELEEILNHKLQTISSYMNLVSNKKNHALLLQEPTVSGFLVLSLGDDDPEVMERSFEVFHALSKFPENLAVLLKVNYLMDGLRCVARNPEVNEHIKVNAKKLISDLKSFKASKAAHPHHQPLSELSASSKNVLAANPVVNGKDEAQSKKPEELNATMSTMKRKNKGRETILFIENGLLNQKSERSKVTQALIGVKGIISVTYDLKKGHCIVRGKRTVAPEEFGRVVASLRLAKVHLVRKNEKKEEVLVHIPAGEKENIQLPPYPEEYENENVADSSTTVDRTDKPRENSSIFKSAKNFIQRSFYW